VVNFLDVAEPPACTSVRCGGRHQDLRPRLNASISADRTHNRKHLGWRCYQRAYHVEGALQALAAISRDVEP
jgi:hypothetical protein